METGHPCGPRSTLGSPRSGWPHGFPLLPLPRRDYYFLPRVVASAQGPQGCLHYLCGPCCSFSPDTCVASSSTEPFNMEALLLLFPPGKVNSWIPGYRQHEIPPTQYHAARDLKCCPEKTSETQLNETSRRKKCIELLNTYAGCFPKNVYTLLTANSSMEVSSFQS